jgi:hypothetical protein
MPAGSVRGASPTLTTTDGEDASMPQIDLEDETVDRLDMLREEDESYDELVNELINIYEAGEMSLHHAGDEF